MKKTMGWMFAVVVLGILVGCGQTTNHDQATETAAVDSSNQPAEAPAQEQAQEQEQAEPQVTQQQPARTQTPSTPKKQAPRPATTTPAYQPAQQPPAEPPRPAMVSVPAGTVLLLATDTTLNSKTAQVEQPISATVVEDVVVSDKVVIPAGTTVHGRVTEAVAAKRGAGNAKLSVAFDTLETENGYRTQMVGTLAAATESKKKRNAAIIGGSAAGGALLGKIIGKDTKSAVIGSVIAGGIGTAVVMGKEGEQVDIPAGTPFEMHLDEALKVPARSTRG
ncbi:MAG: hypothetical protein ACREAA_00185 [Candidatus Polarisedimenticolia bacterium]